MRLSWRLVLLIPIYVCCYDADISNNPIIGGVQDYRCLNIFTIVLLEV